MEQPAANDPLIGQTIGNYEIRHKLGEGGMGSVYMAEHPMIGKKVAVKILHAEFASNEDVVARFFTEAKSVNDIQHPNIVDIVDYGVIPRDTGANLVYFIMEFLAGEAVAQLIRREAPLSPERALGICLQVADALGASHAKGIIHRDLKPDNIILIKRGRQDDFVKVLDFGIAKLTGDQGGSRRTRTGIVMGTPAYMSPEQCEGKGNIDKRTDIYALGILLYEMITGRVPFLGEGYGEVLVQHLTQMPIRPSTLRGVIPPHVEAVCLKALEKAPDARYPNMDEFMKGLSDPVGYVEACGGLGGFLATGIAEADDRTRVLGGKPAATNLTQQPSPVPGALAAGALAATQGSQVNMAAPHGTTLGGGSGEVVDQSPAGGRKVMLLAGLAAVALIVVGVFIATSGGTKEETAPEPEPIAVVTPPDAAPIVKTPPDAKPVKVAPKQVTIEVGSEPAGAEVFLGDNDVPEGTTPLKFALPKGGKIVKVSLVLEGYKKKTFRLRPLKGRSFHYGLTKKRVKTGRTRTGRSGSGSNTSGSGSSGSSGSGSSTVGDTGQLGLGQAGKPKKDK